MTALGHATRAPSVEGRLVLVDFVVPDGVGSSLLDLDFDEALLLATADEVSVGLGATMVIAASGPRRFQHLVEQARAISGQGHFRFFGGLAFEADEVQSGPWKRFGAARFVVPRWTWRRDRTGTSLQLALLGGADHVRRSSSAIAAEYEQITKALQRKVAKRVTPTMTTTRDDQRAYTDSVRAVTRQLREGRAAKVVLARRSKVAVSGKFALAAVADRLCASNPAAAFVFRSGDSAFVGATPERLVRVHGQAVSTEAVAGTAFGRTKIDSRKNLDEHRHVVDWIAERLGAIAERVDVPPQPTERKLPHVSHLVTAIEAHLGAPAHVLTVAETIFPTPAVAGVPLDVALEIIRTNEASARGWYAGAIGSFDARGNGELFVALRSALIEGAQASVFAGAGIVGASDPDAELAETIAKERTMLDALGVRE